jgi:hypothetical protein
MSKLTLISSATASGSANVSFTSGIDSTYDEYVFYFVDVNPATNDANFQFQVNASGQTGFNEVITSTFFRAYHLEDGSAASLDYVTSMDQAQGTAYQGIVYGVGNDTDECCAGVLHLFNPSSTTYVKHFCSTAQYYHLSNYSINSFAAGYINVTAAITEIDFKMSSGNFDGNIYMFGAS